MHKRLNQVSPGGNKARASTSQRQREDAMAKQNRLMVTLGSSAIYSLIRPIAQIKKIMAANRPRIFDCEV